MIRLIEDFKLGLLAILSICLFPLTFVGLLIRVLSKKRWWMDPSNWKNWRRWIGKHKGQ